MAPSLIRDWVILSVESSWPPDATYAYPYLGWRSSDPAPGLYSFLIEFRRWVPAAEQVVYTPRLYVESALIAQGPAITVA
ncbi:hypothetical protein D1J51_15995 [Leucobacter sp. wl10]|nr:hypothetical protein D1J51_15995 [Leucobacter sp. wl10]